MFEKLKGRKPVLLWSGGKDSTLILAMLREQKIPCDIVQIRSFWTKEQLKYSDDLIKKWKLKVFSFPPSHISFIGENDEISAVFELPIGAINIPLLRDVVDGTRCMAELEGQRMHTPPMNWDLWIVGSRKDDTHYALKTIAPNGQWGDTEIYAPLYDWTREEVVKELQTRGLDNQTADTGDIELCHNCIKGTGKVWCPAQQTEIDSVQWDRNANLAQFRRAYQS